jgi:hypothetical protein
MMVDLAGAVSRWAGAAPRLRPARMPLRRFMRRLATPLTPQWWGMVATASLALGLGVALISAADGPSGPAVDATASLRAGDPTIWSPVVRPQTMFVLDLAGLGFDKPALEVRRHSGGGREDVFSVGRPGDAGGHVRLIAYRFGSEVRPAPTLFVEMARRSAESGLAVVRTTIPTVVPTRLGPTEISDMTVTDGERPHDCLAWRIGRDDIDMRLSGWICPAEGRRADRAALVCVIERLDLASAVGERDLRRAFQEAPRSRDPACTPPRPPASNRRAA